MKEKHLHGPSRGALWLGQNPQRISFKAIEKPLGHQHSPNLSDKNALESFTFVMAKKWFL